MIQPVIIDLDSWFGLLQSAGALVSEILHSFDVVINNHSYSGFVAIVGILITSILLYQFWGGEDD